MASPAALKAAYEAKQRAMKGANAARDPSVFDDVLLGNDNMAPVGTDAARIAIDQPFTESHSEFFVNSYSGSDCEIWVLVRTDDVAIDTPVRGFQPLATLQTLTVSSARSVNPVRRLGESHVTEYTRGPRTVAGTLVFATFDRDAFAGVFSKSKREAASDAPFFTDEIPEFHFLVRAANEYGHASHAALTGVTLTNFGTTFSVDDMMLEATYTYVARFYHPFIHDPTMLAHLNDRDLAHIPNAMSREARETLNSRIGRTPLGTQSVEPQVRMDNRTRMLLRGAADGSNDWWTDPFKYR